MGVDEWIVSVIKAMYEDASSKVRMISPSGVTTAPAAPAMRGALTIRGAQNFRTRKLINGRFLFGF